MPRTRRWSRWNTVLTLCALLASAGSADAAAPANCKLTRLTSVDLFSTERGVFVPVSLNGHAGVMRLVMDSPLTVVTQTALGIAGLEARRSISRLQRGNDVEHRVALYDSFDIGNARFGKGRAMVAPATDELREVEGLPILGAVGTGMFQTQDLELDLSKKKLALYSQDHCKGNVVYWADAWGSAPLRTSSLGVLYMIVELEEQRLEATFAPSEPTTLLSTDVTQKLFGFDANSPGVSSDPSEGGVIIHYRAMSLTGPDLQVRNTRIRLISPPMVTPERACKLDAAGPTGAGYVDCENVFPMRLGRNLLQALHLYFATRENVVYFTPAETPPRQ